ncbi:MAG: YchE family NAAT transporter [Buchnera aphidicola (Chaetogeoica yunlongensis)]
MNIFMFDLSIYISFFFSLCALVNPIGMIPIFTSMTHHQSMSERNKTNFITNFSVTIILSMSLLFGNYILDLFGISINSFRISGGILIIMIAMSMISGKLVNNKNSHKNKKFENKTSQNISIVPLAMPLIAGPGAISSTIVWSTHHSSIINILGCIITIILFSCFCWTLFKISPMVVGALGVSGIDIMTRIMGLLLMSLGIEFIVLGVKSIFF